nr:MAG TPA: hypothetical protein [Caudoviricetes sp.]
MKHHATQCTRAASPCCSFFMHLLTYDTIYSIIVNERRCKWENVMIKSSIR